MEPLIVAAGDNTGRLLAHPVDIRGPAFAPLFEAKQTVYEHTAL